MVINGYNINSEIHRGPVTTVYDAYHLELGRRVLLKVLNTQWTNEKDLIDRFRREAKICARLDHPNIVKIFNFNSSEDSVFISMEYIEGSTLEFLSQQKEITNFTEIIGITLQILKGLSFAHQQGIIHRDIKPSNLMISSNGSVKITDFGLAVVSDLPGITGQDQAVGSPAYMSPEQALGKDLDQRSDLFSLGVSLYKLCTKKSPFEADNIGATIQNILTKEVESLSNVNSAIPVWFSELIDTFLSKDRDDRQDSADVALNIINSRINSKEYLGQTDTINLFEPEIISGDKNQPLIQQNSKIQTRIFVWILPIIAALTYLIFSQSDESTSVQLTKLSNPSMTSGKITKDTTFMSNSEDKIEENNINDKNRKHLVDASLISMKGNLSNTENNPDTDLPTTRLEKSQLFVIAKPWADVYIDSVYYEETPLSKSILLEPGVRFIELKNPNYQTFSQYYELNPAQSETLIVKMLLNVGFLNIRVLPWAKIYIDGKYKETSPLETPMTLATGKHIVTLTNPNYMSIKDTIEVISGKILDKKFHFSE